MARPKKQTVDYFPHDCDHKKTMFILEQKYGNDGYAFWFKLLEMLGKSEGHYIDLNDETEWEFLTSKTRLSDETSKDILDLLAKLGGIDAELWNSKIVWSQNFVDRVKDAYRNRISEMPVKPDNLRKKPHTHDEPSAGNPQTKVKESKVNKTKAETEETPKEKTCLSEEKKEVGKNGNGQDDELISLVENLGKAYPKFNPIFYIQNNYLSKEFVKIAFRRLHDYENIHSGEKVKSPKHYCDWIVKAEQGNFNEQQFQADTEKYKIKPEEAEQILGDIYKTITARKAGGLPQ